jgi:hypothetical protein
MSSPTNLTDSLARLRERKRSPVTTNHQRSKPSPTPPRQLPCRERRFAPDLFMLFAYSLLGIATLCQLILIVWLDII